MSAEGKDRSDRKRWRLSINFKSVCPQNAVDCLSNVTKMLKVCFVVMLFSVSTGTEAVATIYSSLRLISLNTHCLSPLFNKAAWNKSSGEVCANRLSSQLLRDGNDYDVVALSEVWDENAKDRFVKLLQPKYPYWVKKISGNLPDFREDSGLMLFSRYPLLNLEGKYVDDKHVKASVGSGRVAFNYFNDCSGIDCMAYKGALAVSVLIPDEHIYNIVLTHLQADTEGAPVRKKQLEEVNDLIFETFGQASLSNTGKEDTFIMGDFNIQGNICKPDQEWTDIFWTKGSFYTHPFYDTWWWTTSIKDCGATNTTSQSRYDYILHNKTGWPHSDPAKEIACVQHITRPFFQSDHRAVFADINHVAPQCMPRAAKEIKAEATDPSIPSQDTRVDGNVLYQGSMQWFRINEPGTYTAVLPTAFFGPNGFGLDMYAKEDLTTPIAVNPGEITTGKYKPGDAPFIDVTYIKFHIVDPSVFIRVYHHDRQSAGPYHFYLHKANCLTPEDACLLSPNEPAVDPGLTAKTAYNGGPVYFKGYIDHAVSGKKQALRFIVLNNTGKGVRMELLDEAQNVLAAEPSAGSSAAKSLSMARHEVGPLPFYLRIYRTSGDQLSIKGKFGTNLRYFVGGVIPNAGQILMYIGDETGTDAAGSDEGTVTFYADGQQYMQINYSGGDSDDHYWFDKFFRQYSQYNGLPVVGYVQGMWAQICEEDPDGDQCSAGTGLQDILKGGPPIINTKTHFFVDDGDYDIYYSVTSNGLYR